MRSVTIGISDGSQRGRMVWTRVERQMRWCKLFASPKGVPSESRVSIADFCFCCPCCTDLILLWSTMNKPCKSTWSLDINLPWSACAACVGTFAFARSKLVPVVFQPPETDGTMSEASPCSDGTISQSSPCSRRRVSQERSRDTFSSFRP